MFISFGLYATIVLQFTTTALWAGIASCVLALNILREDNKKQAEN